MLHRIDGPAPLNAQALEGVGASVSPRDASAASSRVIATSAQSPPSADEVRAAVANANRTLQTSTRALEFEIDPHTDKIIIRLVDTRDRRVLRQIPSQEMINIARALERMQTLLVRGKA